MTTRKTETLGDFMAEFEAELVAKNNTPEALAEEERQAAARRVRMAEEHAKGVRLGWWDEDGNPLNVEEGEDEDEDEDEEEEEGGEDA